MSACSSGGFLVEIGKEKTVYNVIIDNNALISVRARSRPMQPHTDDNRWRQKDISPIQ